MSGLQLFALGSRYGQWLADRQSVIAGNVANANTPGYKSQDLEAFAKALDATGLEMTKTASNHMSASGAVGSGPADSQRKDGWEVVLSGNSVSVEQEMLKAGEVTGAYALNTSVLKTFNRMLLASLKG